MPQFLIRQKNYFDFLGLESLPGQGGPDNTQRFTFVDQDLTNTSFFESPGVFPWGEQQPDDNDGNEDAVE